MANPTAISEAVAHTIDSRSKKMADNVSASNLLLSTLQKSGNVKTISGGNEIIEEFQFAENSNTQSYNGGELLNTGAQEVSGAAKFQLKMYASAVVMYGEERLKNNGPEQMIDLVATRVSNSEISLKNRIVRDLYSDGTGNNNKNITGLQAAIPLVANTGVYGGIDRANVPVWRNKSIDASTTSLGVVTAATILPHFYKMWTLTARGSDTCNLIMLDQNYWTFFQTALQAQQRFASPEKGEAGFMTLKFMDADVGYDSTDTGIAANTAYFLNTKYLKFRPHADRNFVSLGKRMSTNQDADVQFIAWAGNLTSSGLRFQGVIQD